MKIEIAKYWENFYGSLDLDSTFYPSQFAAFVLGESSGAKQLIEFGCGNGRDSFFFASHGFNVIAYDSSKSAINACNERVKTDNIEFFKFAVGVDEYSKMNETQLIKDVKTIIYARFFLHAITDQEEMVFFKLAQDTLRTGSILALEYRCLGDEKIKKEFGNHFRRYFSHDELCNRVGEFGFDVIYQIHGRGYAKYKDEDAIVGRCMAVKV